MNKAIYSQQSTFEMGVFLDRITPHFESGASGAAVLDSVRQTVATVREAAKNAAGVSVPPVLDALLGELSDKDADKVLDSVGRGISAYQREHGVLPTADVVEAAVQQGHVAFRGVDAKGRVLDSATATATSGAHEPTSLQPNRAVLAVVAGLAEAIPFAGYLPFDIGANQTKLAILTHRAGSSLGDYLQDAIMDGTNVGKVYMSSSRFARIPVTTVAGLPAAFKITDRNLAADPFYCDPAATGISILPKRTNFYVNGMLVARDQGGNGNNSAFAFTVTLGATDYTMSGTLNTATGVGSLTALSANLPAGTEVNAESFIDFEKMPGLIPAMQVKAETFDVFANSWRGKTGISPDSQSQLKNELSLDGTSEALLAMRTQMAMERHYKALLMAWNLGAASEPGTYDFDWATRSAQMNRGQIWLDFGAYLSTLDQQMANVTMDHGITHLYGSEWFAANVLAAGPDIFEPSGIMVRPSVYRVGRLFKKYEVYYSPRIVGQAGDLSSATVLAIGRSNQVARNPILLGDAVPPSFVPLGTGEDLVTKSALFGRDFTAVNPHTQSALGTKRITINGLI